MICFYYEYCFQFLQVAHRAIYFHIEGKQIAQTDKRGVWTMVVSYDRTGNPIVLRLKIGEHVVGAYREQEKLMHLATETKRAFEKFCKDRYMPFYECMSPMPIDVYFNSAIIEEYTGYRFQDFLPRDGSTDSDSHSVDKEEDVPF